MRKREIHPDFWTSPSISRLSFFERLLFEALWCAADREGLVVNDPYRIKAWAFPFDEKVTLDKIEEGLKKIYSESLISVLVASDGSGSTCLHVCNFKKYQHIHPNEAKSKLACNYIPGNVSEFPVMSLNVAHAFHASHAFMPSVSVLTNCCTAKSDDIAAPPASPEFCRMPVKEGHEVITVEDIDGWKAIYGKIDVGQTVLKMVAYWEARALSHRKTRRGIRKSIVGWLAKDDDRATIPPPPKPVAPKPLPGGKKAWEIEVEREIREQYEAEQAALKRKDAGNGQPQH